MTEGLNLRNPPYLVYAPASGSSYYFRSIIPKDLVSHFGGLREFRISLKCAIKSRSLKTTKVLNKIVSIIYEEIRQGMKSLEIEDWPCPEKRDNELRVASEFIKELTFGLLRSFP